MTVRAPSKPAKQLPIDSKWGHAFDYVAALRPDDLPAEPTPQELRQALEWLLTTVADQIKEVSSIEDGLYSLEIAGGDLQLEIQALRQDLNVAFDMKQGDRGDRGNPGPMGDRGPTGPSGRDTPEFQELLERMKDMEDRMAEMAEAMDALED